MYRTSGAVTSEIVLERPSRSRVGATPILVAGAILIVTLADILVSGVHVDRRGMDLFAAIVVAGFLVVALVLRTQRLLVMRAGRELCIMSGTKKSAVLASEVLEVEIESRTVRAHTVVFVLRDGRRVPVGQPHEHMLAATEDRHALREALLR